MIEKFKDQKKLNVLIFSLILFLLFYYVSNNSYLVSFFGVIMIIYIIYLFHVIENLNYTNLKPKEKQLTKPNKQKHKQKNHPHSEIVTHIRKK